MRRLLITGATGFVGEHLLQCARAKYEVHGLYHQSHFVGDEIFAHQFDLANVNKIKPLLDEIAPDAIIHTAAIANPDQCERDPNRAVLVNLKATEAIASWASQNGARLIFTSTDMVFDGTKGNYSETDVPNPISHYSQTKAAAETAVIASQGSYVVARVALVYGIGISRTTSFFHQMVLKLTNAEKVTLFDDQFRSPILVENLAEALLELVEHPFIGILHLGGSERISRWELGWRACQALRLPVQYIEKKSMFAIAFAAFRPQDVSLNVNLAKQILKVKLLNCDEGLAKIKATHQWIGR
ncbi:MAG: SDR family oxidoreductase [candidate division KSB1 bacterium]|nr:SDR family oxidoreductase [candidate division KSB1 bacterium]MDZ7336480.1 SDR family oxidoreductase [candidate division KSB1 bacterium]MDZ7357259.1 SDR family oxidoreductase [candidate division KSB1 bacterium]MDZ7402113.1 SDR family oxidoreductase [candidate division KSB1 bacterium]